MFHRILFLLCDVLTKFMQNLSQHSPPIIYGDGSQARDFIHVLDIAIANLAVMNSHITSGFFNVGTENPEFSEWKWIRIDTIVDNIVPFKRDVYSKILEEFKYLLK